MEDTDTRDHDFSIDSDDQPPGMGSSGHWGQFMPISINTSRISLGPICGIGNTAKRTWAYNRSRLHEI